MIDRTFTIDVTDYDGNTMTEVVPTEANIIELMARFRKVALWLGYAEESVDEYIEEE